MLPIIKVLLWQVVTEPAVFPRELIFTMLCMSALTPAACRSLKLKHSRDITCITLLYNKRQQ